MKNAVLFCITWGYRLNNMNKIQYHENISYICRKILLINKHNKQNAGIKDQIITSPQ